MARLVNVGFTKNPRQLAARANDDSAAKAKIKRSFDFCEGIFVAAPWARQLGSSCLLRGFSKIVAETKLPDAHGSA